MLYYCVQTNIYLTVIVKYIVDHGLVSRPVYLLNPKNNYMQNFTQRIHNVLLILFFSTIAITVFSNTINITNAGFTFTPDDITINVGDTVVWQIGGTHNVVEVNEDTWTAGGTVSNGGFQTPFGGGQVVFPTTGTFYYVCQPHVGLGMKAKLTVSGGNPSVKYVAYLGAANESPQRFSPGRGLIEAELVGDDLIVSGSFSNLLGQFDPSVAGGAHIHMGMAGSNGGIVFQLATELDADRRSGRFLAASNTFTLDNAQKTTLQNQGNYINIHTTFYQAGELRGQLVPESDLYFGSNLLGVYQTPAVHTSGSGSIVAQLNGEDLTISGSFSDLESNIDTSILGGAHVHLGLAGRNGGVEFPLNITLSPDLRSGTFESSSNVFELRPQQILALTQRGLYINLHTIDHQAGAIRGQIRGPAHTIYRAHLSGMNENPPIITTAQGMLIAEHLDSTLIISGSLSGLESAMDTNILGGAHIHVALAGSDGPVITPISSFVNADLQTAFFSAGNNSFTISSQIGNALVFRSLYVNVHSMQHQAGELRGQFLPEAEQYFYARLTGGQEVHDVVSTGNGQVIGEINDGLVTLSGTVDLMSDVNYDILGGIHIHQAFAGSNGGVLTGLNLTPVTGDTTRGSLFSLNNIYNIPSAFIDTMMMRGQYINVHSIDQPAGEVRGQLLGEAQNYFYTPLSGASQNGPANNMGSGALALEQSGSQLVASGSFNNLESDFNTAILGGAHLHIGMPGQNGGVAYLLNASQTSGNAGVFSGNVNQLITATNFIDTLRRRAIYANIHSMNVPSGSIRGNALGQSQAYLPPTLSGVNEVDPVNSTGRGAVKIELDASRAVVSGSFAGMSSAFNPAVAGGAHIHNAGPGANGGVLQLLNATVSTDNLSGVFGAANNTVVISEGDWTEIANENTYVNIHSTGNVSGELRGQLLGESNHFPGETVITNPASGTSVTIEGDPTSTFTATWDSAIDLDNNQVVYIWQLAIDKTFDNVVVGVNTGASTTFETTFAVVDALLETSGVLVGSSVTMYHRVWSSDGALQTPSAVDSVILTRGLVSAVTDLPEGQFSLNVLPNPVETFASIVIESPISGVLNIQVVDMKGNLIRTYEQTVSERSLTNIQFDAQDLPAGMYIIQPVIDNRLLASQRILKL